MRIPRIECVDHIRSSDHGDALNRENQVPDKSEDLSLLEEGKGILETDSVLPDNPRYDKQSDILAIVAAFVFPAVLPGLN